MLEWMAWTTPVAIFFSCIVLMLFGMTVWERRSPTVARKGFLPLVTTRGDRLFIGLLGAAYLHLMFVGLAGEILTPSMTRGARLPSPTGEAAGAGTGASRAGEILTTLMTRGARLPSPTGWAAGKAITLAVAILLAEPGEGGEGEAEGAPGTAASAVPVRLA